jgi:hypothetical protein
MDNEGVESGKGQVGQGKREVGRLPEAIEGSEAHRPKELVIPGFLHDKLSTGAFFDQSALRSHSIN